MLYKYPTTKRSRGKTFTWRRMIKRKKQRNVWGETKTKIPEKGRQVKAEAAFETDAMDPKPKPKNRTRPAMASTWQQQVGNPTIMIMIIGIGISRRWRSHHRTSINLWLNDAYGCRCLCLSLGSRPSWGIRFVVGVNCDRELATFTFHSRMGRALGLSHMYI